MQVWGCIVVGGGSATETPLRLITGSGDSELRVWALKEPEKESAAPDEKVEENVEEVINIEKMFFH